MKYKELKINGVQYIQAVNPYPTGTKNTYLRDKFTAANSPIIWVGPTLPEGAELDESDLMVQHQHFHNERWIICPEEMAEKLSAQGRPTRQAATLKAKAEEGEPGREGSKTLPPLIQSLADAIKRSDCKVAFGLEAQGHIPTIERILDEIPVSSLAWTKIGKEIGWDRGAARDYYITYLRESRAPSPKEQPGEHEERTFTATEIERLQSAVYEITGDGEVMKLFNKLLGVNAG